MSKGEPSFPGPQSTVIWEKTSPMGGVDGQVRPAVHAGGGLVDEHQLVPVVVVDEPSGRVDHQGGSPMMSMSACWMAWMAPESTSASSPSS